MSPLADRIAERLHHALDHHDCAGISAPTAERGLAVGGPDNPVVVLSVKDVARIAALVISDDGEASRSPDAAEHLVEPRWADPTHLLSSASRSSNSASGVVRPAARARRCQ